MVKLLVAVHFGLEHVLERHHGGDVSKADQQAVNDVGGETPAEGGQRDAGEGIGARGVVRIEELLLLM